MSKYVPPARRSGANQELMKGAALVITPRAKFKVGDYVSYKGTEVRITRVIAGYGGKETLYKVRPEGTKQIIENVTERDLNVVSEEYVPVEDVGSPVSVTCVQDQLLLAQVMMKAHQDGGNRFSCELLQIAAEMEQAQQAGSSYQGTPSNGSRSSRESRRHEDIPSFGSKKISGDVNWHSGDRSICYNAGSSGSPNSFGRGRGSNRTWSGRGLPVVPEIPVHNVMSRSPSNSGWSLQKNRSPARSVGFGTKESSRTPIINLTGSKGSIWGCQVPHSSSSLFSVRGKQ